MHEELLEYYNRELAYLRQMGAEFGRNYPQVARRLMLDPARCEDPHVERLLEGVAFMAARIHRRLDDDFPQLSEALLQHLYPTYLRPIPSMMVVECLPLGKKTTDNTIKRGTPLESKLRKDGKPVRFQTCYETTVWPMRISEAEWTEPARQKRPVRSNTGGQPVAAARLRLSCSPDVVFAKSGLKKLRFHLFGEIGYPLYELLSANCFEIQLHELAGTQRMVTLGPEHLCMVGFDPMTEAVLPFNRRSMDGYRLLQEYFTLPEKFLFFEIDGLEALDLKDFGREADIVLLFSRFERPERQRDLEASVTAQTFRLGCTPAINLFQESATAIQLSQQRAAYPVDPEGRFIDLMEVFSIDEVCAATRLTREKTRLEPLLSYRHQTLPDKSLAFWSATRETKSPNEAKPSAMKLSVVDVNGLLIKPKADVLEVRCTFTNFNLPSQMSENFGDRNGDFDATGCGWAKVAVLRGPTKSVSPPDRPGQLWRLISHLSLNYLSLTEEGCGALQEILRVHNYTDSDDVQCQIGAIAKLQSKPKFAMVPSEQGHSPARGTLVEMELDERQFTGASAFLFGTVIERFLAGYSSMNSFAQLCVRTNLRKEPLNTWPPRAGSQVLL